MTPKEQYAAALSAVRLIRNYNRNPFSQVERNRIYECTRIPEALKILAAIETHIMLAAVQSINMKRYDDSRFMSNRILDAHWQYKGCGGIEGSCYWHDDPSVPDDAIVFPF